MEGRLNMMSKRVIKIIAVFVFIAFTLTYALPTQEMTVLAKSLDNITNTKANISYEQPKINTTLGNFAKDIYEYISKLKVSLENEDLEQFKDDLKASRKAVKDIRNDIFKELNDNNKRLNNLKVNKAKIRHNSFETAVEKKLDDLEALFEKINESLIVSDVETLQIELEKMENQIMGEQPEQPIGNSLPHNNVSIEPAEPATGGGIGAAYMSTNTATGISLLSKTPTDEDLAETPETKLTQEIMDLADTLKTSVKIQEYVRNNIDFEPYYGSRKGAAGTLSQMAGNDYDQASLLISMLRYKGIPARYVKGTVEIPINKVIGWTGAENAEAAIKILGSLGTPTVSIVSGGAITAVHTEHVWVEAYVAYENYRGIGTGKGKKIWIPIDPSFKQYSIEDGLDIKEVIGVTDDQILEAIDTNGEKSEDGNTVTNVNIEEMSNFIDSSSAKLEQYIKDNNLENTDAKQLIGGRKIIPEKLGLLPLSLPYKTVTVISETNSIPYEESETIGFAIRGNDPYNLNFTGSDDFNVKFRAVEFYGKRVTLSWTPASQEDVNIIDSYGGVFNTPAYMIQLKPQLKADGEVIAEGNAVGFGYRQEFTIEMGHVGRTVEKVVNTVTVGGYYNVALDYGKVDQIELKAIQERLYEVKDKITQDDIYTDEVMGDILNAVGKAYFAQLDGFSTLLSRASNVRVTRQLSEAMTGFRPGVKYMFMIPVEVSSGSFFIDVDHDVVSSVSNEGKKENETGYMLYSGVLGSAMEHGIFEQILQLPSVSSIKVLTEASNRGIPIYNFDKTNIDRIDEIKVSSSVKTDVLNAVNSGKTVIIPKEEIRYYDWSGSGYIVIDTDTGAAGYMISGGLAGGSAAVELDPLTLIVGIISIIMAIYDTIMIAMAILSCTSPLLLVVFYGLYVLSVYALCITVVELENYIRTGDYESAKNVWTDFILNIAFCGGFKILEKILPGLGSLFKTVSNRLDDAAKQAAESLDEMAESISRIDGPKKLPDADTLVKELADQGVDSNLVKKVADSQGASGLDNLKHLLDTGKATQEEIAEMIAKGINLDDAKILVDKGIPASDFAKYGIKNSTEAKTILDLVNKGYRLDDLAKLVEYGYTPSGMISKGLKTAEEVQRVVKALTEAVTKLKTALKTNVERVFETIKSIFRNGDDLKCVDAVSNKEFTLCRSSLKSELIDAGMSDEVAESVLEVLETGCFSGDTLVSTRDGLKRIDTIKEGDYVLSKDVNSGTIDYKEVKKVYIKSTYEFIHLKLDGEEIRSTSSHLFFTDSGWWKAAENLKPGDKILNSKGELKKLLATRVDTLQQPEKIYNLNVDGFHTYFVGIQELLVHNNCYKEMLEAFNSAVDAAKIDGVTDSLELAYIGREAAMEIIDGFKWGEYLKSLIGDPSSDMLRPHAHHILFKDGLGPAQKELVKEGQEILFSYGMDPIKGVENLVWAPNKAGQHTLANLEHIVSELRNIKNFGGTKEDIIKKLQQLGQEAARR